MKHSPHPDPDLPELMPNHLVSSTINAGVQTIEMLSVETRNALSLDLQQAILTALEQGRANGAKVVVLKGCKEAFSSGYNVNPTGRKDYVAQDDIFADCDRLSVFADFMKKVRSHPMPVISQIQGYCVAGGTDLMLSSDIALAADTARIGVPNVRGLGISMLATTWPMIIGPMRTKLMMFTGDLISGVQAAEWGLVASAVPVDDIDRVTLDLAKRIALMPASLLVVTKLAANRAMDIQGLDALIRAGVELDAMAHFTQPVVEFWKRARGEGLKSALRERDAHFFGNDFSAILRSGAKS